MDLSKQHHKFKKILVLANPSWRLAIFGLFSALLVMGLEMIFPLIGKSLIDFTILKLPLPSFSFFSSDHLIAFLKKIVSSSDQLIMTMIFLGVLIGLFTMLENFYIEKFQREFVFHLKTNLFTKVLYFPFLFLKRKGSNYLVSRITRDVDFLQYFFGGDIVQLLTSILGIIFCLSFTITLNFKLSMGLLVAIPLSLLFDYFCIVKVRKVLKEEREKEALLSQKMQEIFAGIDLVKAYQTEKMESKDVKDKLLHLLQFKAKNSLLKIISFQFSKGAYFCALIFVTVFSIILMKQGKLSVGDYLAFLTYTTFLTNFASNLTSFYFFWQPLFLSCDRIFELLETVPEENSQGQEILSHVQGEIRFDKVSFSYQNSLVLNEIEFTLPPKTTTAILGASGIGKSTLVGLLLKFFSPNKGQIFLDGKNLQTIQSEWLRKNIALVSQDLFLFNTTIKENLSYGFTATEEEVFSAAQEAGIHDEILALEKGYETIVGERGSNLSMGQRQRIALARAILKKASLLIFDEPTSALDKKSEKKILDLLKNLSGKKTILLITHRTSLTTVAHQTLFLEKQKCSFIEPFQKIAKTHEEVTQVF